MNLNKLKIFYAVAKRASFSLAGKDLCLSQPAISIQIRLLEDYFDVQLIERVGRNIKLTEAGEVLFSFAERIFEISQEAEMVIADYRKLGEGTLKIHTTRVLAKCYLPEILNGFKKSHPKIKLGLKAGNSQEAVDGVLNFESDIAIAGRIPYDKKLLAVPFFKDQVVLVSSISNDLYEQKRINFKTLTGKPIIIREEGSGLRNFTFELFKKNEISFEFIMELGNDDAIKKAVEHGIGLSFMTYSMVKEEVERGILGVIELSDMKLTRDYDIVFHKARKASNLIKAFTNEALNAVSKLKAVNPHLG